MDRRQNFYETLNRGNPDAIVNGYEPFTVVLDPVGAMLKTAAPGKTVVDPWGVTMHWGEGEPGAMPIVTDETVVCPDVTRWKEYVKAPDIAGADLDWQDAIDQVKKIRDEGQLAMGMMSTGVFEQAHSLLGFEDALMDFLIEPDAMHELLEYLTEYKLTYAKLLVENIHPDVILFHDDWGTKSNLFMNEDTWREFFKERYSRIYGYLKENGIITIHHADSHCELIVQDMVEIGIDVWQGVLPQNDIQKIKKETGGQLILMGGIDAALVDLPNVEESTVRAEVRRACDEYLPGGSFIPCLTYGKPGSIYPNVDTIIADEVRKISAEVFPRK